MKESSNDRRQFLKSSGLILAGATIFTGNLVAKPEWVFQEMEEEVSPNEDLMREHGVLKRVLLVYQVVIDRIYSKNDFPPDAVIDSANIIRSFIEDYHEKLEEDYLFPRL